MLGLSALSEGPISATVEVAGPVATITCQVGAIGASPISAAPIPMPEDDNSYMWDKNEKNWIIVS